MSGGKEPDDAHPDEFNVRNKTGYYTDAAAKGN
jgi:hypothetical protein